MCMCVCACVCVCVCVCVYMCVCVCVCVYMCVFPIISYYIYNMEGLLDPGEILDVFMNYKLGQERSLLKFVNGLLGMDGLIISNIP